MDEIGVIVIEGKELGAAIAAGERKTTGLFSEDFSSGVDAGGIAEMGPFTIWEQGGEQNVGEDVLGSWSGSGGTC
jgi:hypothetical protein